MLAVAALLAIAVIASPPGQGSYPVDAVLDEFRSVCIAPRSLEAIVQDAETRGWQRFEPTPGTPIADLLASGKKMLAGAGIQTDMPTFWKNVESRRLELVLNRAPVPFDGAPRPLTGCNMYDPNATAALPDAAVRAWAGRKPTNRVGDVGIVVIEWKPGLAALPSQTRIGFISPSAALEGRAPFAGIALTSSIFEEGK